MKEQARQISYMRRQGCCMTDLGGELPPNGLAIMEGEKVERGRSLPRRSSPPRTRNIWSIAQN